MLLPAVHGEKYVRTAQRMRMSATRYSLASSLGVAIIACLGLIWMRWQQAETGGSPQLMLKPASFLVPKCLARLFNQSPAQLFGSWVNVSLRNDVCKPARGVRLYSYFDCGQRVSLEYRKDDIWSLGS